MCGRTAQSIRAIEAAARLFDARTTSTQRVLPNGNNLSYQQNEQRLNERQERSNDGGTKNRDFRAGAENLDEVEGHINEETEDTEQYGDGTETANSKNDESIKKDYFKFMSLHDEDKLQNMSPGYSMFILRRGNDPNTGREHESPGVIAEPRVWGLITRPGSASNPLPEGPSKHFAALMFNARSEDASEKPTFGRLIRSGQSCILPVDGFYEWKASAKNAVGGDHTKKQPYFVHHAKFVQPDKSSGQTEEREATTNSNQCPLYMAGLYNSVATGRIDEETGEKEILKTFTIFTTSASPQLKWLHTRMPLVLSDVDEINAWLHKPSSSLLQKLREKVSQGLTSTSEYMSWHPVTKQMNSAQYHGQECMIPVKIETLLSVTSFFGTMASKAAEQKKGKEALVKAKFSSSAHTSSPGIEKDYALPREDEKKVQKFSPATTSHESPLNSFGKAEKRSKPSTTPTKSGSISTAHKRAKTFSSSSTKATSGTPSITSFFAVKKK